ncbi:hypothetical protein PRIPAC_95733 [Pristionchus pacificus]|uniref:Uncharacterized protein n=1 Tax=Pristionchus pacificus TaxID=54126 RepID=A0A2A6D314_PRIPA|nr:hypothetical protein PRIPAC_95733 [Pristionchus pacificus]|eukprot:PDM84789.1 hypothetical protein PRIPAC_33812 [Pristionchus pacificus]
MRLFNRFDYLTIFTRKIDFQASFTSGSALGVFSQSFPNDKQLIAAASGCMSVPFTLMNINFLHRTYYVVLFSKQKFLVMCSLYPLTIFLLWYGVSISAADNGMGKSILRKMAPEGITVEEGWLVLRFWEYGRLHIRGVVTLLCGGLVILVNLSIGATLCCLTIYHLMRFSVLFLTFVFLLNTVNIVVPFNVPPKGGLCFAAILGDCRRCECPRGRSCRKGKCV